MIQNNHKIPRNAASTHLVGNTAETLVKLDLLNKGYFIYSNDFAHGPADIIALKPEPNPEVLMVDVKTDSKKSVKFDWNVIGGRRDAKLEVEPDA